MYPSCDTIYTGVMLNVEITRTIFLFVCCVCSPVPSLVVALLTIVSFRLDQMIPNFCQFIYYMLRANDHREDKVRRTRL